MKSPKRQKRDTKITEIVVDPDLGEDARETEHLPRSHRPMASKAFGVRPLKPDDLPEVSELFLRVFGTRTPAREPEMVAYLRDLLFGNPLYSEENGGVVYTDKNKRIISAVLGIPMGFVLDGEPIVGRLMCAFMADGAGKAHAAARLSMSVHPKRVHEFSFSDNASARSAAHGRAGAAKVAPLQSLLWERPYRPVSAFFQRWQKRIPAWALPMLYTASWPVDVIIRALFPSFSTRTAVELDEPLRIVKCGSEEFRSFALSMMTGVRLRPTWSQDEFDWLHKMARKNTRLGDLQTYFARAPGGDTIAAFMIYEKPGATARLMHLFAAERDMQRAYQAFFDWCDQKGFCSVVGQLEGREFLALTEQTRLFFKANSYFCLAAPNDAVHEALEKNSAVFGGLASETWSRLTTDF